LFTRDFDWYQFPNLSHISLVVDSPETFNKPESARQSRIVLWLWHVKSYNYVWKVETHENN
jgi:hypothetical protein